MKSPFTFKQVYLNLNPGELGRYEVRHDGTFIGYATRFYGGGYATRFYGGNKDRWFAWTAPYGRAIWAEQRSRKACADVLYEVHMRKLFPQATGF